MPESDNSILYSVKKLLGVSENSFDSDIIMHINTVLATLNQLGVGPKNGFAISGEDEKWTDFMGDDIRLNLVKSYVHAKVRILFDPPTSSAVMDALNRTASELEWRILAVTDYTKIQNEEEG